MDLLIAIGILVLCYFTGSTIEKNHYKSIRKREVNLYKFPCISSGKMIASSSKVKNAYIVSSSVVIACDYFKLFVSSLKSFFGGNVSAVESVIDRGRREAILRIREQALRMRAKAVINLKIETVMLNSNTTRQAPKVCVTAYGTAIEYDR